MQFRKVGSRIQVLGSVYDPAAKRCRQKMLGSFSAYWPPKTVPADLADNLTPEQQAEVSTWLAEWHAKEAASTKASTICYAPDRLREIALLIEQAEVGAVTKIEEAAKVLNRAINKRRRAMKRGEAA